MTRDNLVGIIFAAGKGRRIKRNKPLVETRKRKKLIEYPIELLSGHNVPIEVFLRADSRGKEVSDFIKVQYGSSVTQTMLRTQCFGLWHDVLKHLSRRQSDIVAFPCDLIIRDINLERLLRFHYDNNADITLLSSANQTYSCVQAVKTENGRIIDVARGHSYDTKAIDAPEGYSITSQSGVYVISHHIIESFTEMLRLAATHLMRRKRFYERIRVFQYVQSGVAPPWIHCGIRESYKRFCNPK